MILGIGYLLLLTYFGHSLRISLLPEASLWRTSTGPRLPAYLYLLPIDVLTGVVVGTTSLYFFLLIGDSLGQIAFFFLLFCVLLLGISILLGKRKSSKPRTNLAKKTHVLTTISILVMVLWGIFLTWKTFYVQDDVLYAGYTVFSDLSPHSALVSSFGQGGNIPAQYPHFSGAGMGYHFFFYFFAGNLRYLGMPIDWAMNLPSLLGTWAFLSLLSYLAVKLSRNLWAMPLTILLFMFRSSFSAYVLLADGKRINDLYNAMEFAGPLARDEWGLYNLNVYANQRHLLWGLAVVLVLLIIYLPKLEGFQWNAWYPLAKSPLAFSLLLALPLPYWHGSAAIAGLLILALWALFSGEKLSFLILGLTTVISAFVLRAFFTTEQLDMGESLFQFGYILDNPGLLDVLRFFILLFGPMLLVMVLLPILTRKNWIRVWSLSLFLPSLFAFTVSLTPDVMVNHKFLMMTQIFYIPLVVWVLLRMLERRKILAIVATLYIFSMLFTGITDFWAYRNQSTLLVRIPLDDAFSQWMYTHTSVDTISLTPPWAMHSYFLTGRQSYYGHSYYAHSAGYDTDTRYGEIVRFLAAADTPEELKRYARDNKLSYLMIDDSLRYSEEYYVNEIRLEQIFPRIGSFPDQGNLNIYDLRLP